MMSLLLSFGVFFAFSFVGWAACAPSVKAAVAARATEFFRNLLLSILA